MRHLRAISLALLLALVASIAHAQTTWNPADKNANITLSNGDLTASAAAGGDNLLRSTDSKTSGKWYWEVTQDHNGSEDSPGGIGTASMNLSQFAGQTNDSTGWYGTNQFYINGILGNIISWNANDVLGLALDLDASPQTLTIYNVTQSFGPGGVVLTGKGNGHDLNPPPWFALADVPGGSSMTINFGAAPFLGTIPAGYAPWNGVQSNGAPLIGVFP